MEKYRDIGFKLTPQRLAILGELEGRTDHPSAEEIYRAVSKNFPTMSVATVYSALEALRRRGRLLELAIEPGKKQVTRSLTSEQEAPLAVTYEVPVGSVSLITTLLSAECPALSTVKV